MVDMLPFPRIMGDTPDKQIVELVNYLVQFKETLEFALTNISTENLSPELINKLNDIGVNIERSTTERENELAQIKGKSGITVSDVINSASFNLAIKGEISKVQFTVNPDTGHLEYTF